MSEVKPKIIPPQVNYHQSRSFPVKYRYHKLVTTQALPIVVPTSSTAPANFKIGSSSVFNKSRSLAAYQVVVPASAANTFTWTVCDTPELINKIVLTDGKTQVCEITYAQNYARLFNKMGTRVQDYLTNDLTSGLAPCNSLTTDVAATYPVADGRGTFAQGGCQGNVNYIENQYVQVVTAAAQQFNYTRVIPFGVYKESIFGIDTDSYYGRDMQLNLQLGPANKMCFTSTSGTDPTLTPLAQANSIYVTSFIIWLAEEVNTEIVNNIKTKYESGVWRMLIPSPNMTQALTSGANGSIGITFDILSGWGLRLQKVLWQPFNSTESSNTLMDTSNYNGQKITKFRISLDAPLTEDYIYCTFPTFSGVGATASSVLNMDDYRENYQFCKDKVIGLNYDVYQMNWFNCNSWVNSYDSSLVRTANIEEGLDLSRSRTYQIQGNTGAGGANLTHYLYAITQREMVVHPQYGIQFDMQKSAPPTNPVSAVN